MLLKILKTKLLVLVTPVHLQSSWVRSSWGAGWVSTDSVNHKGQGFFLTTHKLPLDFVSDVLGRCPLFLNLAVPYNFHNSYSYKEDGRWRLDHKFESLSGLVFLHQVFKCICIPATARKRMLSHPFRNGRARHTYHHLQFINGYLCEINRGWSKLEHMVCPHTSIRVEHTANMGFYP